jgi:Family of unknown function (DUF5996)
MKLSEGQPSMPSSAWPELPYAAWKHTLETLHRWTQIAGKVPTRADTVVVHIRSRS